MIFNVQIWSNETAVEELMKGTPLGRQAVFRVIKLFFGLLIFSVINLVNKKKIHVVHNNGDRTLSE